jgi:hypothetical protein
VDGIGGLAQKGCGIRAVRRKAVIFRPGDRNALTQKVFEGEQGFVARPGPAW